MGLTANTGFIVAMQVLDMKFDGSLVPRSRLFHHKLTQRARQLTRRIATEWAFPGVIQEAFHSQIDGEQVQSLGGILYAGDKLSKLYILSSRGRFRADIDRLSQSLQVHLTDSRKACYVALSD